MKRKKGSVPVWLCCSASKVFIVTEHVHRANKHTTKKHTWLINRTGNNVKNKILHNKKKEIKIR